MKATKKSLWLSAVSLMLCAVMLLGTTFAWFTDSVTNTGNVIQAGNLDAELRYRDVKESDPKAEYTTVTDETPALFGNHKWEPGYSYGYDFCVMNKGTLAFDWELTVVNLKMDEKTAKIADVLEVYTSAYTNDGPEKLEYVDTLANLVNNNGGVIRKGQVWKPGNGNYFSVVIKMKEDADNDYQGANVTFDVVLRAKQAAVEEDGFGSSDYDADAEYDPISVSTKEQLTEALAAGKPVALENDIVLDAPIEVTGDVTIVGNGNTLDIPSNASRVINVAETTEPITITLKDLDMPGPTTGTYTRGISLWNAAEEVTIVMDNCSLGANYYAINSAFGNDKITAVIRNSTITGWAVLNTHSPYANLTFENCTLIGNNDKPYNADGWNGFATFVFDNASGNPDPDGAHDCTLTFKDCRIEANSLTGNAQYFFSIRAINTTINAENCTFVKNGEVLTSLDDITSNISVRDYAIESFVLNVK